MCFTLNVNVHRDLNTVHWQISSQSAIIVDPGDVHVHELSLSQMSIKPPTMINTLCIYSLRQLSFDPLPTSTVCADHL